ncbi:MAG: hypothetical protein JWQ53_16 [Klenkia sp.]|nr:hypothetical protein [Klenkia sp.]
MRTRTALLTAWTGAAVGAAALGFLALAVLEGPAHRASAGRSHAAEQSTVAGSVVASCVGDEVSAGGDPRPGWAVASSAEPGEVVFLADGREVRVDVGCGGGRPWFVVVELGGPGGG